MFKKIHVFLIFKDNFRLRNYESCILKLKKMAAAILQKMIMTGASNRLLKIPIHMLINFAMQTLQTFYHTQITVELSKFKRYTNTQNLWSKKKAKILIFSCYTRRQRIYMLFIPFGFITRESQTVCIAWLRILYLLLHSPKNILKISETAVTNKHIPQRTKHCLFSLTIFFRTFGNANHDLTIHYRKESEKTAIIVSHLQQFSSIQ